MKKKLVLSLFHLSFGFVNVTNCAQNNLKPLVDNIVTEKKETFDLLLQISSFLVENKKYATQSDKKYLETCATKLGDMRRNVILTWKELEQEETLILIQSIKTDAENRLRQLKEKISPKNNTTLPNKVGITKINPDEIDTQIAKARAIHKKEIVEKINQLKTDFYVTIGRVDLALQLTHLIQEKKRKELSNLLEKLKNQTRMIFSKYSQGAGILKLEVVLKDYKQLQEYKQLAIALENGIKENEQERHNSLKRF